MKYPSTKPPSPASSPNKRRLRDDDNLMQKKFRFEGDTRSPTQKLSLPIIEHCIDEGIRKVACTSHCTIGAPAQYIFVNFQNLTIDEIARGGQNAQYWQKQCDITSPKGDICGVVYRNILGQTKRILLPFHYRLGCSIGLAKPERVIIRYDARTKRIREDMKAMRCDTILLDYACYLFALIMYM